MCAFTKTPQRRKHCSFLLFVINDTSSPPEARRGPSRDRDTFILRTFKLGRRKTTTDQTGQQLFLKIAKFHNLVRTL